MKLSKKIKYWITEIYLMYLKIQDSVLQYRPCDRCGKKHLFEMNMCDCGCLTLGECVCNECDKKEK